MLKIAVLIASYNRFDTTLRGMTSIFKAAENEPGCTLEFFLLDDQSPDHTGRRIKERFPSVHLIGGTGDLYWTRGMARAFETAKVHGDFDAYLLFNDDVEFSLDALQILVPLFVELNAKGPSTVVGAVASRQTGETNYSGFMVGSKYRAFDFRRVPPNGSVQECDTFNGNVVLALAEPMHKAGGLHPFYRHGVGDIDLGLSLRRVGCRLFITPSHVGYCEDNAPAPKLSLRKRLNALIWGTFPLTDQIRFTYRRYTWPFATIVSGIQVFRRVTNALVPWQIYKL